jgi:hypothetical protein
VLRSCFNNYCWCRFNLFDKGPTNICTFYLNTTTGARGTDHPPFSNFLFTNLLFIFTLNKIQIISLFYIKFIIKILCFFKSYLNFSLKTARSDYFFYLSWHIIISLYLVYLFIIIIVFASLRDDLVFDFVLDFPPLPRPDIMVRL